MDNFQNVFDNATAATTRRQESRTIVETLLTLHRTRGARAASRRLQDAIGGAEIRQQLAQDVEKQLHAAMEQHISNQDAERRALETKIRVLEHVGRQRDIALGALQRTCEAKIVEIATLERILRHKDRTIDGLKGIIQDQG